MKSEIKKKRMAILMEIDALNVRQAAGEDVTDLLEDCGHKLTALTDKPEADKGPARLTKELLTKAQANGISRSTMSKRVYCDGWDPEEAATRPVQKKVKKVLTPEEIKDQAEREIINRAHREERKKWKSIAESYGIKWKTYRSRRSMGWSPEEAATTLPNTRGMDELRLKAHKNGIDADMFRSRVQSGWTEEEAASYPKGIYLRHIRATKEGKKETPLELENHRLNRILEGMGRALQIYSGMPLDEALKEAINYVSEESK